MKRGFARTSKREKLLNISFSHHRGREGPPGKPFLSARPISKREPPTSYGRRPPGVESALSLPPFGVVGPVWAKRCGVEFTSQDTLQVIPFRCAVRRKPLPEAAPSRLYTCLTQKPCRICPDVAKLAQFTSHLYPFADKMASGVTVDAAIPPLFNEMKFRKTLKVAFFRISDDGKRIIVDEERQIKPSEKDPFGAFIKMLPSDECRYIVFDVAYGTKESGDKNTLLFIAWAPEDATIKSKMVHASSKDYIKKELQLETEWDLHDMADAMNIREMGAKLKGAMCVEGRELGCK